MSALELPGAYRVGKRCAEVEDGTEHLRRGRLEQAAACFERALGKAPQDARTARLLAESRVALGLGRVHAGDSPGARVEFQRALRLDPTQIAAARFLAHSAVRAGEPDEALRRLDDAAVLAPEGLATRLLRAVCLEALGRRASAVAALDGALAAGLAPHQARPRRLHWEHKARRPSPAPPDPPPVETARDVPAFADQRCRLGVQLVERRPHEAAQHFEAALALNPRYLRARLALALLRLDQGRAHEAGEELARAHSQAPGYPDVQGWLGLAQLRSGDVRQAATTLERAVASRREFARAHRHLALAYHALGRTGDALQAARRGWVRRRDAPLLVGATWPPGFEAESAREDELAMAVAIRPTSPDLWLALGRCHRARGNAGEARGALRQALSLQGDYAAAALELARLELALGQVREAEALLAALTTWKPRWADAQAWLGRTRLLLGNPQGAVLPLKMAMRLNPALESARTDLTSALLLLMRSRRADPRGDRDGLVEAVPAVATGRS